MQPFGLSGCILPGASFSLPEPEVTGSDQK